MIYGICLAVTLLSCLLGTIVGMGGGFIIKPVLDATGVMSGSTITFLCGCTIVAMTGWNTVKNFLKKNSAIELKTTSMLAVGAAVGGLLGKQFYNMVKACFQDPNAASGVQACLLLTATFVTLIYTINKDKVRSLHVKSPAASVIIGLLLGMLSAFLGIGGGPFNVAVLYLFFSMETKKAAQNSLFVALISQVFATGKTALFDGIPEFKWPVLLIMIVAAIAGSEIGRLFNKKIDNKTATGCLEGTMVLAMLINVYNIIKYLL